MTRKLTVDQAHRLVAETLIRCNTAPDNAGLVADALVDAELAGQGGHGLRRVPSYGGQAASGKVDGHAVPKSERVRPGLLAIDAASGFAYPAIALAMEALPGMAREQGVAAAGIRRSSHAGVTGLFVEDLARQGLVAMMLVNTPAAIAPWGGARGLYGTNPIAFAAPVPEAEPLVIDLSVSKVARGRIMAAGQKGEAIPEGWAFDAEGRPTTDPAAALSGTMAPMADAKGAALALMVEILSAGVTGAQYGYEASSFFTADGPPPGTGQLLLALDPGALYPGAVERIGTLAAAIEGEPDARLPGRRRQQLRARIEAEGIPLDAALAAEIDALGR
ncbi:MAG TPA: Ldh family oxidoreductase [Thermohalobaculum sp.]|nr:Ldh family oxidoreductase [Thermohalobaculum sp.]